MEKSDDKSLNPDRICAIRESLGLSQVEAGELIGGGPRAFAKYEAGTIKPAAAVVNLLKILEKDQSALAILTGKQRKPTVSSGRSPVEVKGKHIEELSAEQLVYLTQRLLAAEAFSHSVPASGIHVAENITTPDDGIDAEIKWIGGPERTRFLPGRLNSFQLKSGKINPAAAAKDVLNKDGSVKSMVRSSLEGGGTYILLCASIYNGKQIKEREEAIREALKGAGLNMRAEQVIFYDATKLAEWINTHPSVAIWLLEQAGSTSISKLKTWTYWEASPDHATPWVEDLRLVEVRKKLLPAISKPRGVMRILGPSGVGKSRLILEAFKEEKNPNPQSRLSDLVLHIDEQIAGSNETKLAIQNLADSSTRAIVVVDRCDSHTHDDLVNLVEREGSYLSLVTIDDQPPFVDKEGRIIISEAKETVIDGILKLVAPNLPGEDHRRLVRFSHKFPKIAILLGQSWAQNIRTAKAPEEIVEAIIKGREKIEPDLLFRGAQILSFFGLVYEDEIETVSTLGRDLTPESLRSVIHKLESRGIVQRKGKSFMIQPRPVALCLAEKEWNEWGANRWDEIITGDIPEGLKERAIDQLALMNSDEFQFGIQIGKHLLRRDGPLDSLESLSASGRSEIFSSLAEIDSNAAVSLLERALDGKSHEDIRNIEGDTRRHIIWALNKICFVPETFERGAKIMLDFAVAENESWANNATGQFKSFFPVYLGDTAADGEKRLRVIDDAIKDAEENNNEQQLLIVIEGLLSGIELNHFSRSVGSETHGSRPALDSWQPKTWGDLWNYIEECCNRLIELAKRKDSVGDAAKKGLGYNFRALGTRPLLDVVERAVKEITAVHGKYWPEAYESLGDIFVYDREGLQEGVEEKVQSLLDILQPETLEDRVRLLITEMPWDYPCDEKMSFQEREEKQREAVTNFAKELLDSPEVLKKIMPMVCSYSENGRRGQHRTTPFFGKSLAEQSKAPLELLELITSTLEEVEKDKRDLDFLSGFLWGLSESHPDIIEDFKKKAAESDEFAPALASICFRVGIKPSDIFLVIDALKAKRIEPSHIWQWSCGGVLAANLSPSELAPLLDHLIGMGNEGFSIGIDLMGMYAHGRYDVLNELMPQIKHAAEKVSSRARDKRGSQMDEHHFQDIMKWVLKKGKKDPNARAIALILTHQLIALVEAGNNDIIRPLVSQLLSDFSEISWPHIGQAIISEKQTAWRFEHLLGDTYSFGERKNPPILQLPEDQLFSWCYAYPNTAPAFVAAIAPVLTSQSPEDAVRTIHPTMRRLLDEFGESEDVLTGIARNIGTYSWAGSRTTYFELYELPLKELENHPIKKVRVWAQKMLQSLGLQKEAAQEEDEEQEARWAI